jgi:hypothetical protein
MPEGWNDLREELVGLLREGEEGLLDAPGRMGEEGEDPASMVFVVVTDEREFPFRDFVSFLGVAGLIEEDCC